MTTVSFATAVPHNFAVTASTRVQLFDGATGAATRGLTRFRDVAYSGTFRADGQLLVAGGKHPMVQVFHATSRAVLKRLSGHSMPVHAATFTQDQVRIVSASDDKTVKHWDMTSEKALATLSGHTDYVQSLAVSPTSPSMWASGSFDHTARLWDVRAGGSSADDGSSAAACVLSVDHGDPIFATLMLPGGGALLTAGSNTLKVWDLLAGGKLVQTFSSHQKAVTCVCLDGTGTRLLSGSADCHVKVYDLATYKVVHGWKYDQTVMSLACAPDNSRVVVGMSDGTLSVRDRDMKLGEAAAEAKSAAVLHGGTYKYFLRGQSSTAGPDDYAVRVGKKPKLQKHDVFLKKFQYQKALNAGLDSGDPVVVITVLEELVARAGLRIALSGRDEVTLEPLVAFVAKYITHPRYASLLIDVCNVLFGECPYRWPSRVLAVARRRSWFV